MGGNGTRAERRALGKVLILTLTIQDSKPLVQFLKDLGNIISQFENKPIYQPSKQITLREVIP
jgi:hypothetical protein